MPVVAFERLLQAVFYENSDVQVTLVRKTLSSAYASDRGFSILELVVVITVGIILTAMAIPQVTTLTRTYRSAGDARSLSDLVSLAKMRAAAEFTDARVYADLTNNLYRVETWTLLSGQTQKCWVTDGDTQCSANYSSPSTPPSTPLSSGVTYGYGSVSSPPSNTQSTLGQAAECQTDAETRASGTAGTVANSACVVFNSRGIPIDYTMTATSNDALYVTDGNSAYGVTILATGLVQTWRAGLSSGTWSNR